MDGARSRAHVRDVVRLWAVTLLLVAGVFLTGPVAASAPPPGHGPSETEPSCAKNAFCVSLELSAPQIDTPGNLTAIAQAVNGSGSQDYSYQFFWGDTTESTSSSGTATHYFTSAPAIEPDRVSVVATDSGTGKTADANATVVINPPLSISLITQTPVANVSFTAPLWENFTLLVGGGAPPYYINWTWGDGTANTFVVMPTGTTSISESHEFRKGRSTPYVMSVFVNDSLRGSWSTPLSIDVAAPAKTSSGTLGFLTTTMLELLILVVVVVVLLVVVVITRRRRTAKKAVPSEEPPPVPEAPMPSSPVVTETPEDRAPDLPVPRSEALGAPIPPPEPSGELPTPERYVPPPVPHGTSAAGRGGPSGSSLARAIFAAPADRCPICGTELTSPHAPCPVCTPSLVPTTSTPSPLDLPPLPGLEAPASTTPPLKPTVPPPLSPTPPVLFPQAPWTPPPAFAQTAPPPEPAPRASQVESSAARTTTASGPVPFSTASVVPASGGPAFGPSVAPPPPSTGIASGAPSRTGGPSRALTCLVCGSPLQEDGHCPSCGMRWTE